NLIYLLLHHDQCGSVYFFSSRRRHTSSYGDWSSDVCSSDLSRRSAAQVGGVVDRLEARCIGCPVMTEIGVLRAGRDYEVVIGDRSEERRVGKEGRCVWGPVDWNSTGSLQMRS